jgi:hypothetical protein
MHLRELANHSSDVTKISIVKVNVALDTDIPTDRQRFLHIIVTCKKSIQASIRYFFGEEKEKALFVWCIFERDRTPLSRCFLARSLIESAPSPGTRVVD